MSGLTYLACPYSDPDPKIVQGRMDAFFEADVRLTKMGHNIVSPLYKVQTTKYGKIDDSFGFWEKYCYELLSVCSCLIVLTLPGWEKSTGIKAEIEYARNNDIMVVYYSI